MPFRIVSGDITKLHVDAIVNAANNSLLGGGGVDGAIHRAAGPRLLEECRTLHGCETGEAKVTLGYDLPAKYVIHTVGPIWHGGAHGEEVLLRSAYRNSLLLALEKQCESVAFPMISAGVYGYPKDQALEVAVSTIRAFLEEQEMDVTLVIFDRGSYQFDARLCADISRYMQHTMAPSMPDSMMGNRAAPAAGAAADSMPPRRLSFLSRAKSTSAERKREDTAIDQDMCAGALAEELCEERSAEMMCAVTVKAPSDLVQALENLDESFSQALLRLIDERGMKDAECYKKANIDRKLFSKIRSDVQYRPSKQTVLAFAVALELTLPEAEALLKKAGYALSHSNKSDVIVEYFIRNRKYDIYSINEALFAFDQNLLGA